MDSFIEHVKKKKTNSKTKKSKFKMYVYRFSSDGEKVNSKPCAECTRWMICSELLGITYDIYYVDDQEKVQRYDKQNSGVYHPVRTYF